VVEVELTVGMGLQVVLVAEVDMLALEVLQFLTQLKDLRVEVVLQHLIIQEEVVVVQVLLELMHQPLLQEVMEGQD
jgi:hypothetical protein